MALVCDCFPYWTASVRCPLSVVNVSSFKSLLVKSLLLITNDPWTYVDRPSVTDANKPNKQIYEKCSATTICNRIRRRKLYKRIIRRTKFGTPNRRRITVRNLTTTQEVLNLIRCLKYIYIHTSGFGGLGVACWPLVPKYAGSNPAGFFRAKKSWARLPSEGK